MPNVQKTNRDFQPIPSSKNYFIDGYFTVILARSFVPGQLCSLNHLPNYFCSVAVGHVHILFIASLFCTKNVFPSVIFMEQFKQKFAQLSEEVGRVENVLKKTETSSKSCKKQLEECKKKLEECKNQLNEKERQFHQLQNQFECSHAAWEQQCDEQINALNERNTIIQSQMAKITQLQDEYKKLLEARGSFLGMLLFCDSICCGIG